MDARDVGTNIAKIVVGEGENSGLAVVGAAECQVNVSLAHETQACPNVETAEDGAIAVTRHLIVIVGGMIGRPICRGSAPVSETAVDHVCLLCVQFRRLDGLVREIEWDPLFKEPVRVRPRRV